MTEGAVYADLAASLVDAAGDVLDVGHDLGGMRLGAPIDVTNLAEFFRLAAEANMAAFESSIIEPVAKHDRITVTAAEQRFAADDTDYSLAVAGLVVIRALPTYFGGTATGRDAEIGRAAVALYNRTAGLMSKYSSLGSVDPKTFRVTIPDEPALTAAIAFAQNQVADTAALLQSQHVSPMIVVGDTEVAGVDAGDATDQLHALTDPRRLPQWPRPRVPRRVRRPLTTGSRKISSAGEEQEPRDAGPITTMPASTTATSACNITCAPAPASMVSRPSIKNGY